MRRWNAGLACLGFLIALQLILAIAERLKTSIANEIEHGSTRVGWYFRSGQWLADVRTFSAACQFVMEEDGNATGQPSPPGIQLAAPESETTPVLSGVIEPGKLPLKDS